MCCICLRCRNPITIVCLVFFFFFLMIRPPPSSTLFPYPPLFRSRDASHQRASPLAPMTSARPVDRPRACQFACRSPRSTTHACRHDVQEERSVCKGMASLALPAGRRHRGQRAGSSTRLRPSCLVYFFSQVLTEIVPPRLVAREQQIG